MNTHQSQAFSNIALDASQTFLSQAQKAQQLLFSATSEQLDLQAKAFNELGKSNPESLWNQGSQMVREQAERAGTLMRQLGEIQVETLQSLGSAGRKAVDESIKGAKARK